ncbi:MAG: GNAT family N-acetyltransferase [Gemmatimonadales bacterium]
MGDAAAHAAALHAGRRRFRAAAVERAVVPRVHRRQGRAHPRGSARLPDQRTDRQLRRRTATGSTWSCCAKRGAPIGMCGLIKRVTLESPDIGYAFVPEAWGVGYALEAASAILQSAWRDFAVPRVLAITNAENDPSQRLLLKLGFVEEAPRVLQEGGSAVRTFGMDRPAD